MPIPALSSPRLARIALVLAIGALAWRAGLVTIAALDGIDFPLALDYGEGAVLQMALRITEPDAYGDIARYPFLAFPYPPAYLLAVRGIAALGVDLVVAGRVLAISATLAMCSLVGALVHAALGPRCPPGTRLLAAVGAGCLLLGSWSLARWMPFARIDTLAIACTLGGLLLALRAPGTRWNAHAAALLFTLAVYTRQTTLAAPLAATLVLLLASPRDAARMVATGLVLSLVLLAGWTLRTEGGFLRHLVAYNIHYYHWPGLQILLAHLVVQAGAILLALLGGVEAARRLGGLRWTAIAAAVRGDAAARVLAGILLYAVISTPLALFILKAGSTVNYLLEWMAATALLAGLLVGWMMPGPAGTDGRAGTANLTALALAVVLVGQAVSLPDPTHFLLRDKAASTRMAEALIEEVRAAPGPVLSDEMLLLIRAGKEVPWEPAMFEYLYNVGQWDERLVAERIRAGYFAFLVTLSSTAYTPAVRAAVEEAFPRIEERGWLVLRRPAK